MISSHGIRVAIEILWIAGLALALVATLVVLKESFLVLGVLRDIQRLAGFIETAAAGIATNVESIEPVQRLARAATPLPDALGRVAGPLLEATADLRRRLEGED